MPAMHSDPGFLDYLLNTHYLPAVGIALITLVSLMRTGLAIRWPWFATKLGGYALGFGSSAMLYVGETLRAGAALTAGTIAAALAAGWVAAGGWEMIRDLLTAMKKPPAISVPKATAVSMVLVVMLLGCSSCKDLPSAEQTSKLIVDCTRADQGVVNGVIREMLPLVYGEKVDWKAVEDRAIAAGVTIGGCALAELAQLVLGSRKAPTTEQSWGMHDTLEKFRETIANGASFRTAHGDL